MKSNALFFAWNRSIPGRERISHEHFQEFVEYLGGLQKKGSIASFEPIFLNPHGGDMNGFFLIRGEPAKLEALTGSPDWERQITRAAMHLQGVGVVGAAGGELIRQRLDLWKQAIPNA